MKEVPVQRAVSPRTKGAPPSSVHAESSKRPRGGHRDAILDAAEAVVLRDGMGRLTLDAVARQAGLSKPGLLHHFAGKDALIDALVARQVEVWHAEFLARFDAHKAEGSPCPATRALMCNCLEGTEAWTESERARNRVLVAALVHSERHVEPLRKITRQIDKLLDADKLPPGVSDTIHFAIHGLWFQWIFGMGEVSDRRLDNVRRVLASLANQNPPPGGSPARRRASSQTNRQTQASRKLR